MSTPITRSQQWAQRAFACVEARSDTTGSIKNEPDPEYLSFAKRFPSLVHTCGLVQALAFAENKGPENFIQDIEKVIGIEELSDKSRKAAIAEYLKLSRETLIVAGWIKRYAEALLDKKMPEESDDAPTGG